MLQNWRLLEGSGCSLQKKGGVHMEKRVVTWPNAITITRGFCGIAGIYLALQPGLFFWGALVFFSLGMCPDALDGWVARRYAQRSRIGEFLDPFVDKILFYSGMFVHFIHDVWMPALFILLICDVLSTILHFTKSGGAVKAGKYKFILQCVALVLFFLGHIVGEGFLIFANMILLIATICAVQSLVQRLKA